MTRPWAVPAIAILLMVAACDRSSKLEEGVSTELQVRKEFGEPVTVTVTPDGTRTLEYPRQPEGWANYVIQIGPDGTMSSLRQLLNPDNFAKVKPGLSREQVRVLLGRPAKTQRFELKHEEVWDWRFKENGQQPKLFSVSFDDAGRVSGSGVRDDPRESVGGPN
jgi:hypothetical protein